MTPEQYASARRRLVARTLQILVRQWLNLGSWRDRDVARFQRDAFPVLQGAQRAIGQMVAVRVASSASRAAGRVVPVPSIAGELLTDLRDGVSVADEYRRPFEQTWYGISQGEDVAAASERGRLRLVTLADVDLQMSETSAGREAMSQTGATWWRRVPQGEKTCLLCLVASTRAYYVADLKPIHPACDCLAEEQYTPRPADGVHDPELLSRAYDAARMHTGRLQTSGEALRSLLADFTDSHSEVGPILVQPRGTRAERQAVAGT